MYLNLIILKSGLEIITLSENLDYEPSVHLHHPCTISGSTKITLKRWPVHTSEEHIMLNSEDLLTVCEPTATLAKSYMKKFKLKEKDVSRNLIDEPTPAMLTEEALQAQGISDFEEDYEPQYEEI